ncbi:hypothetical protein LR002_01530, partial [Candidatus Gracilibacteria bacterium]|nr:hypothetical protein [Candidatus Gracilibacteria bacterium]
MINFIKNKLPHNLKIRKTFGILKGFLAYLINFGVLNGVQIVGITGTDGKTSATIFTAQLLQNLGIKTAAMSSELFFLDGKILENKTKRTTASPFVIFNFIKKAKNKGVKLIIIEVSSHSLEQGRLFGINFDYSAVLNLSQEHLDYHGTIEKYAQSKAKIIGKAKKSVILQKNILCKDVFISAFEKSKKLFLQEVFLGEGLINKKILIGKKIRNFDDGILFDLEFFGEKISDLKLNILGEYNVENLLFSLAIFNEILKNSDEKIFDNSENFSELRKKFLKYKENNEENFIKIFEDEIKKSVSKIFPIPGRFDELKFGQDFKIFISFAVTPQAVEKTLKYSQKIKLENGKVFLVFGATGGQHDHGKRPILGEVAGNFADVSVLTDDETYGEDSMKIMSEVEPGLKKSGGEYEIIQDRGEAIRFAL